MNRQGQGCAHAPRPRCPTAGYQPRELLVHVQKDKWTMVVVSVTTKITKKEAEAAQVLINRKVNALVTGCAVSRSRDDRWNVPASMYCIADGRQDEMYRLMT